MMEKIKALYRSLAGDWIKDALEEIKCVSDNVCARVDKLSIRAQVDEEDGWFLKENMKKPLCTINHNNKGPFAL